MKKGVVKRCSYGEGDRDYEGGDEKRINRRSWSRLWRFGESHFSVSEIRGGLVFALLGFLALRERPLVFRLMHRVVLILARVVSVAIRFFRHSASMVFECMEIILARLRRTALDRPVAPKLEQAYLHPED
jgi:hypothetical protein